MFFPTSLRVLTPSCKFEDGQVSMTLSDFQKLLHLLLLDVEFDAKWYEKTNGDVQSALHNKKIKSAFDHYCLAGYIENRLPFRPLVDDAWYLKQYPDVAAAIAAGRVDNATDHFVSSGYLEGRLPRKVPVDSEWYTSRYQDAKDRIQNKTSKDAEDDFMRFGYQRGYRPHKPRLTQASVVR